MQLDLVPVVGKKKVPKSLLSELAEALGKKGFVVKLQKEVTIPASAFNKARGQYDASAILPHVKPEGGLGITAEDLYEGGLNFVFGLGETEGSAVVSIARLDPERYGEPGGQAKLIGRLTKEVVHEVGHTLGMKHCENKAGAKQCVMAFSEGVHEVDEKGAAFCKEHAKMIDLK
jgi:archaemetzincin